MIITALVPVKKGRSRVFLDDTERGTLPDRDIRQYGLAVGSELREEVWQHMEESIILPAGKKKALDLLLFQERTRKELRSKLADAGYTEEQTDRIFEYVEQFPYLDDVRYAQHYFQSCKGKSYRQMEQVLSAKGVDSCDIEAAWNRYQEECRETYGEQTDPESEAVRKLIEKKLRDDEQPQEETIRKLIQSLLRKGFSYETVKRVMRQYIDEL